MKLIIIILVFCSPFLGYSQLVSLIERGDTLFKVNPQTGAETQLNKLGAIKATDTANMFVGYLRKTEAATLYQPAGAGGNFIAPSDTASMLNKYLRVWNATTLYQPLNTTVNISDSASMLSKYLRSNVAAATYQPIGNYQPAGSYVVTTDTAVMLDKYLREWDATTLYQAKGNYQAAGSYVVVSDTTVMLDKYLREWDASTLYQPIGQGGGNYRTLISLGADVTNSTTTIANVTGLSFAVTSGTTYRFYIVIPYTSAATTTGSRWTLTGPANTLFSYTSKYTLTATTQTVNYASANDIPAAANASSLTAGNVCIIEGLIKPSANGTLQVRFASEVAASAIVAKAGSSIEHW